MWQVPHVHLLACFAMKVPSPHLGHDLFFLVTLSPDFSYKFHLPFFAPFDAGFEAAGFAGAAIFLDFFDFYSLNFILNFQSVPAGT